MVNPTPVVEDPSDYSPTSPSFPDTPYLYDLLIDQPPPSILPSEASSAWASEPGSAWASEVSSIPASEVSSVLASEANSALTSEAGSALASDSDLPLPSPTKATKQTDLHGFFSKVPSKEPHEKWRKRKRDDEDKDREKYAERKRRDEAEQLHKLVNKRLRNQVAQKKRRDRLRNEKATLAEAEKVPLVSHLVHPL